MKICPNCQEIYADEELNFCLNDGGILEQSRGNESPTILLNRVRPTNENFQNDFKQQLSPWQTQPPPYQPPSMPLQQQHQAFIQHSYTARDQTLPIISLLLGSSAVLFSFCCLFGGFITFGCGAAALVTGFMGMNNVNQNPQKYGGKPLAIAGIIAGGIGILISLGLLLLIIIAR